MDFKALKTHFYFSSRQALAVLILVSLLFSGGVLIYLRSKPSPVVKEITSTKNTSSDKIVVHVCGAVNKSGVYSLNAGSRVIDALEAAGGFTTEACLDVLNLAARAIDGQRIYVPKEGEVIPFTEESGLVNLNTATIEELDKLPGIGEIPAQRIIDYRKANDGFKNVEELQKVEGIGLKKFEDLKDKVTVN